MEYKVLENILNKASELKIMVVGDYFLDHYLYIDPQKEELSLETGKAVHQVTRVSSLPGAAGNVVKNLVALGVKQLQAVGLIGSDSYGYELRETLHALAVDTTGLLTSEGRLTPTYIKPMVVASHGGEEELNRLDLQNWRPTPPELEDQLNDILMDQGPKCDAIIVVDQTEEADCGVITGKVRTALMDLGKAHPDLVIFVDSRQRIGEFRHVMIKPNEFEGAKAVGLEPSPDSLTQILYGLYAKTGNMVFLTCGSQGQWVYDGKQAIHVPAMKVEGAIDIVGAGDSTSAGTVLALASGASYPDAALMGNLVASITITQLGTTGVATPQDVIECFDRWRSSR